MGQATAMLSVMFINGEANCEDWNTEKQTGHYGSCCNELDIWESNKISTTYVPHGCTVQGQTRCEGTACSDDASGQRYNGVCDKDDCDFNPYRLGNKTFFGPYDIKTVDSTKPFTVALLMAMTMVIFLKLGVYGCRMALLF